MIHFVAFPFSLCLNYCFFFLCSFLSVQSSSLFLSLSLFLFLSLLLPIHLSVCQCLCFFFLSLTLFLNLSIYMWINLYTSINPSIYLAVSVCTYICICLYAVCMYHSIYITLSVSQSISPSVSLSINQSIDLFPSHVPSAHQLTLTLTASIPYTDFRFPSNFIASPLHLLSPIPRDCRLLASLSSIIPIDNAAKESELPRRPLRHVTLIYITAGDPPQPR